MSFMAIGFLYPSEINSNRSRNLGAAIAMVTNWVGVYVVVSITPIGESSPERQWLIHYVVLLTCPRNRYSKHRMAFLHYLRRNECIMGAFHLVLLRRDRRLVT